ncbi:MAG: hypothetical protein IIX10_03815, partial [Clostridia bacterium]|nr:hypothetical protein [Clostridia bacterium]
ITLSFTLSPLARCLLCCSKSDRFERFAYLWPFGSRFAAKTCHVAGQKICYPVGESSGADGFFDGIAG